MNKNNIIDIIRNQSNELRKILKEGDKNLIQASNKCIIIFFFIKQLQLHRENLHNNITFENDQTSAFKFNKHRWFRNDEGSD